MRFKQWLEFETGTIATGSAGMQDFPGSNLNTNYPVLSKISCKDGSSKSPEDDTPSPDKVFGFRSPSDKKATTKRSSQWINKNSRPVPISTIPPDIIY